MTSNKRERRLRMQSEIREHHRVVVMIAVFGIHPGIPDYS